MYAANDLWLSCTEPEILAFDGTPTAVNCIAGAIYEKFGEELNEYYDELVKEKEEEEEEEENE